MDTRFWGPSGWRLLHLIAAEPITDDQHRKAVLRWFCLLPYILPCKYCRASFSDYLEVQPLTPEILESPQRFGYWLYAIHNRVNGKLRGQGLITTRNPSWPEIRSRYQKLHSGLCKGAPLLGWDFMTSVAYTTPEKDYTPTPMPDLPEEATKEEQARWCEKKRNRYNLLTREERIHKLEEWWRLIPSILPCSAWRLAWSSAMRQVGTAPLEDGKKAVMQWMWSVEQNVCHGLKCPTPHSSFPDMRAELTAFESGCGKARRGKTCRARKEKRRHQIRRTRKVQKGLVGGFL